MVNTMKVQYPSLTQSVYSKSINFVILNRPIMEHAIHRLSETIATLVTMLNVTHPFSGSYS